MKSCRECKHQVSEQAVACPDCGAPYPARERWDGYGFEYKSQSTFLGLPLLHISFKYRPNRMPVVAKGVIAVGQFGVGIINIQFGIGVISLGSSPLPAMPWRSSPWPIRASPSLRYTPIRRVWTSAQWADLREIFRVWTGCRFGGADLAGTVPGWCSTNGRLARLTDIQQPAWPLPSRRQAAGNCLQSGPSPAVCLPWRFPSLTIHG